LYAQSFLHPGAGVSTEVIDLPIQREAHNGYPVIPASSLKGSLRDLAVQKGIDEKIIAALFGQASDTVSFAGALIIGDGRILAFPVRSLTRTFFWVSSPLIAARVKRDLMVAGLKPNWGSIPEVKPTEVLVPEGCDLEDDLYLEEMNFKAKENDAVSALAKFVSLQLDPKIVGETYVQKLEHDFALVSDSTFSYLVRFATHVNARIKLTSAKTTGTYKATEKAGKETGNLWYEEVLPSETIFYALVSADRPRGDNLGSSQQVLQELTESILSDRFIQLGANETLGQGWCAAHFAKGGKA